MSGGMPPLPPTTKDAPASHSRVHTASVNSGVRVMRKSCARVMCWYTYITVHAYNKKM